MLQDRGQVENTLKIAPRRDSPEEAPLLWLVGWWGWGGGYGFLSLGDKIGVTKNLILPISCP